MSILLSCLAGLGWAANMVTIKKALDKNSITNEIGAFLSVFVGAVVAFVLALVTGASLSIPWDHLRGLIIVGAIAPGISQITFFGAIRGIGSARAGVLIGTAPMWAVLGAWIFASGVLTELVIIGTVLTILGGVPLGSENTKERLKLIGVGLALFTAFSFGARDVVANEVADTSDVNSALGAAVIFGAGAVISFMYLLTKPKGLAVRLKEGFKPMILPGVIVGFALSFMQEAFERGRVEIVSPLVNATQSVAVVAISAAVFGRNQLSKKLIWGLVFIATGAVLIGLESSS